MYAYCFLVFTISVIRLKKCVYAYVYSCCWNMKYVIAYIEFVTLSGWHLSNHISLSFLGVYEQINSIYVCGFK